MTKYKVWQLCADVACEDSHEVREIEVEDGECPACQAVGPPPPTARDGASCVMAYIESEKPTVVRKRELTVITLKAGLTASPSHGFFALLIRPLVGWECHEPTAEDLKRHGL